MSAYYPIGTVVSIELDRPLQVMIAGYLPKRKDSRVYDYFAVPFPLGLVDETAYICFDQDAITEVLWEGYRDETCQQLLQGFDEMAQNIQKLR